MTTLRTQVAIGLILLSVSVQGAEHYIYTTISLCQTFECTRPGAAPAWDSGAWVESRLLGFPYVVGMNNSHRVYEDNSTVVAASTNGQGFWSDWHSYLYGGPREGHCYNPHLDSTAGSSTKDTLASPWRLCWSGSGGGNEDLEQVGCPIILNPSAGPWRLTGMDGPVQFDLDGDGHREPMGWTAAGDTLAFLASDLNGNGAIDDGKELFGIGTLLASGERAANGFEALAQFDVNRDRVIDSRDPVWDRLLLWNDRNHDAQSQTDELLLIGDSAITALELEYRETRRRDRYGNTFRYRANCRVGQTQMPFYDVFFVSMR
ncbi:MAG: hypothetical protein ACJ74H_15935 [Thermoanaerobaculia bacterium]